MTSDFGQVDVGGKRLKQTAVFLARHIVPTGDDKRDLLVNLLE
jgi:hypothetical protein